MEKNDGVLRLTAFLFFEYLIPFAACEAVFPALRISEAC